MTVTEYVPPLTKAQRAALAVLVAAGAPGADISNRTATGPPRVHHRAGWTLVGLGYARSSQGWPFRFVATARGRQRVRIEYRRERRDAARSD